MWCYVDPSCDEADKKETFFFKGAYVPEPAGLRDMTKSTCGTQCRSQCDVIFVPSV